LGGTAYLTSRSILDLDIIPRHLIAIGGNHVGLEVAPVHRCRVSSGARGILQAKAS
jgi:pyruvate/2-oxoglutarate dehydrogenase complex dihydrolipoamide dehydrogenase (E3) component